LIHFYKRLHYATEKKVSLSNPTHFKPDYAVKMLKKNHKDDFLEKTKVAREERQQEKIKVESAIRIQSLVRGWLARLATKKIVLEKFNEVFPEIEEGTEVRCTRTALEMFHVSRLFLHIFNPLKCEALFERMLKYLLASIQLDSPKLSFIGVFLNKDFSVAWIKLVKELCSTSSSILTTTTHNIPNFNKKVSFYILVLISFTSSNTWKICKSKALAALAPHLVQLNHNITGHLVETGLFAHLKTVLLKGLASSSKVLFKKTTLSAINSLSLRPVIYSGFSEKLVSLYILNILCVPSFVHQLQVMCPEALDMMKSNTLLQHTIRLLSQEQQLKIHFNALEGSYALCLAANLVNLLHTEKSDNLQDDVISLVTVLTRLLESCSQYVTAKQSNLSHWHPVLGWFSVSLDKYLQSTIPIVKLQIARLWHPDSVKLLTHHLQMSAVHLPRPSPPPTPSPEERNAAKKLVMQAIEKTKTTYANTTQSLHPISHGINRLGNADCTRIALVCTLYQTAIRSLSQLRLEILIGLCYGDILLKPLWLFLNSLGPNCGLKSFLDLLNTNRSATCPEFQMLTLFCDTFGHLVTILDDSEFYERGDPFALHEYALLGQFINTFLYKAIWSGILTDPELPLFASMINLLAALRRRDERRSYTHPNFWLMKEARISTLVGDLAKGKTAAHLIKQNLPHIIPHRERVLLFRNEVHEEKCSLGILDNDYVSPQSSLITVHRSRLVEDGYRQLSTLSSHAIKGVVRVKFVNLQGLDEAGIDQDGVFKEFLEETIKKVFDPGLNLFCTTSEERLYPSPLSHITDNHLDLFEFVGKMIGKAVYEGIVVDVPFASFFLTQVLGHDHTTLYSYFDEMSSSDPELYKNLTYIKHYEGDVEDLGLTFSFDQDVMGRIVSHELVPGGRSIDVTNRNRILYIHMMAHFKMHKQIQSQVAAFRKGFRSVVSTNWLSLFSGPEVQRLISGDNTPVDLKDLRKNTSYYGGFHDSHKVIIWLWDILDRDFNDKEKGAFLKFVTSCSKPPLLGFYNLEPPFSIRCVEVSDEEDDGDTVGSVLRGFLAIKKKDPVNRLPTASTCFNLLKLPNYQKKSTLREKLRYAISFNSGFELS